jgi:hypothetical protein
MLMPSSDPAAGQSQIGHRVRARKLSAVVFLDRSGAVEPSAAQQLTPGHIDPRIVFHIPAVTCLPRNTLPRSRARFSARSTLQFPSQMPGAFEYDRVGSGSVFWLGRGQTDPLPALPPAK